MNAENLPPDWQIVHLKSLAKEYLSGGTPPSKKSSLWNGIIAWTTSAPISEGDVSLNHAQRFISQEGLKNSSTNLVPKGNLLVGTRVGVGKAVTNTIDVAISQDLTGVILNHALIDAEFAAYQMKIARIQSFLIGRSRGTTIKGISRYDLQSVELNLPPLPEQRAIARALRTVQEAKEARRREIAIERERKAALMQHLFTHGTRNEPRKQTEIGAIPESWRVMRLGEVITLQRGYDLPHAQRQNGSVPIISSSGITGRHVVAKALGPGVVTGRYGTLGEVFYIEEDFWPLNTTLFVREFNGNDPEFISHLLRTMDMQTYNDKTSVPGINRNHVHGIVVGLPSLSEQCSIAETLRACDTKIAVLEREAGLLDELFRALLEELMSGRLSAVGGGG